LVLSLPALAETQLPTVAFHEEPGSLLITIGDNPFATYVYADETITRPYFAHVHAPCGLQVTRTHPPQPGDSDDHADMHPGLWLAFGDLSGHDYWRLKAKVKGGEFVKEPTGGPGKGTFIVRNRYLATDSDAVVCIEICEYTVRVRPEGYLLISDSTFSSDTADFYFGDQEEMGLGVRMATPIAVKSGKGGRILDSEGRANEDGIWGNQAAWCDYSGIVDGHGAGICIMPHSGNFRPCWWHTRDYGFMAANPFGVNAFTGGDPSRVVVKQGNSFRLRYGILVHDGLDESQTDLGQVYQASATTSMEWRNDPANLDATRLINDSYQRMPFSRECEGVLDNLPLCLDWEIGPNTPVCWKGGVAGLIGDDIILVGGLWMPPRANLAYAYNIPTRTYAEIPSPPVRPQYTQGACDGEAVYLVGGRGSGRAVYRLAREPSGDWAYTELVPLPEAEGDGRWLASVGLIPGKWLFLVAGHPTGKPMEQRDTGALLDYRLRLDDPNAQWEPMAAYPGGTRALVMAAAVEGRLYVFGGSQTEPTMRANFLEVHQKYGLRVPYNGVPNYRDAYRYAPEADAWEPIRSTPFPVLAGCAVPLNRRFILLMGSADDRSYRVGKTQGRQDPFWTGYGDRILCYDILEDNYSHIGVMPYGVATSPWVCDGQRLYSFGGEPAHLYTENTENVLQIGTMKWQLPE
jgi:hypothetical protein